MFKKRILGLLLILALLFTGCGNNGVDDTVDKDAFIERAQLLIEAFDKKDYETMDDYCDEQMKDFFTSEENQESLQQVHDQLGEFKEFGDADMIGQEEDGVQYYIIQQKAQYENHKALYTLSFTEDMKLSGFYVK